MVFTHVHKQVDELLKQRDSVHSSFTVVRSVGNTSESGHFSNGSGSKIPGEECMSDSLGEESSSDSKDISAKKKWFNFNLKGPDKK